MLRGLTWQQFREWEIFDQLEPFGEERNAFRFASIVQALYNIFTRSKDTNPRPLGDFLLAGGDIPRAVAVQQTVEYQERVLDAWISTNNAIYGKAA